MQSPLPNPQYGPPGSGPQSSGPLTSEEKNWAMGCHLAAFSGYLGIPFGHILGPLIVWMLKRDTSAFINEHGKEAMNYNISICIYAIVYTFIAVLLFITVIGIPLAILGGIALAIADVIVRIMGAIKASNGEHYSYPMTIRFLN